MYACLALVLCQAHHHLALSLQRLTAMCTAKLPFSPFEKKTSKFKYHTEEQTAFYALQMSTAIAVQLQLALIMKESLLT